MDEIVVVATRVPTASFEAPYQVKTVPAFSGASVRSPRTVTDALHDFPQIMVQKTGYGQASEEAPGLRVTVSLRSVNNRYLDLSLRLPEELRAMDPILRVG